MSRDLFAREALTQIPRILTQLDRNPHSPTFGCFDRNFWHYKIIDFPSGMSQEFVWPLALAMTTDVPGNRFFQQEVLRYWCQAAIRFAGRSAHPDGSCDDYFPFERAAGAAAFSLLACLETYDLLDFDDGDMIAFFTRRADWLAHHMEAGRLANHQALIALCLDRLGDVLETSRWTDARDARLDTVLSWQNPEGWFQEYEGCDPGYHTLTVSCLARIHAAHPDHSRLEEALRRAVDLARAFIHPDGTYGGEYTSRNTYNYFPHGFEVIGRWMPEALELNTRFVKGLEAGLGACYADDHIVGHHTWNYLLTWRDWMDERPAPESPKPGRTHFPQARLLIDRRHGAELFVGLNKGGVFRFFRDGRLVAADTGVSLRVRDGKRFRNAVAHLVADYEVEIEEDRITIAGPMGWAKQKQMNPKNLLILRVVMLTVGRFFPNLIRKLLQKMLITGKKPTPYSFTREIRWSPTGRLEITDEVIADRWREVVDAGVGADQTSIYVVMSRTFQPGQLQPWHDLSEALPRLEPGEALTWKREV